jgi:Telomeric repeat-binding factor 2.
MARKKTEEVYPSPGEESRKLHQRADEFLEKAQKQEEALMEEPAEAEEKPASGSEPSAERDDDRGRGEADRAEGKKPDNEEKKVSDGASEKGTEKPAPSKPRKWPAVLTMTLVAVIVFVLGVYLGSTLKGDPDPGTKQAAKPDNPVTEEIKDDLALHNVVRKDELYGVSLEVDQMKRRVDGLYVTFRVKNDGRETVYFMANTMKLIGDDGNVYLPELGQGDVPMTFMGGGITPGTAEAATLVFDLPKNVEPASFILENVTNLKNGSWTFQIDLE